MADIQGIGEAHNWNISRIADAFGLHRQTVKKRLDEAGVVPAGKNGGSTLYALSDVGPALFGQQVGYSGSTDPDDLPPQERRAWYQSENERIKVERELHNLVEAEDVRREYSALAKAVTTTLDSLPDVLERDAGLDGAQIELVQNAIDQLREQLYQAIVEDENE